MNEPINLNKARKALDRAQAFAKAAENRVKFGRTKAEKAVQTTEREKLARDVDAHKRER